MTLGIGIQRTLLPKGFLVSGVNSGVRRYRPDIGLLVSDEPAVTVGVFTENEMKAAPVLYSQQLLPSSKIRAIVTNSGQANAATGAKGLEDNLAMVSAVAKSLGCHHEGVLSASTGVIGQALALDKIAPSIPMLVERLSDVAEPFALAILTTDLVPKTVRTTISLSQGEACITGICKGSGMIHPNMGTMLAYLLTDLSLTETQAQKILKDSVDRSFNMISVDGDSSTNDCAFLMANGKSGVSPLTENDFKKVEEAFLGICQILAQAIASDGEGATKLIEVNLQGISELNLARKVARGVIVSPLVKTAIYGEDPNWGRVLARMGAEGLPAICFEKMNFSLQGVSLFKNGSPLSFDRDELRALMKKQKIVIDINCHSGPYQATAWGCDLSHKYVDINTEYS